MRYHNSGCGSDRICIEQRFYTVMTLGQNSTLIPSRPMTADGTSARLREIFLFSKKHAVMEHNFWSLSRGTHGICHVKEESKLCEVLIVVL